MSIYRRGGVYWFKFALAGQQIRESAHTASKTVAREAERARRRDLELGINRIGRRKRMPLFKVAAREWLAGRTTLAANTIAAYRHFVETLVENFGDRLICDIDAADVALLQQKRIAAGWSGRTVNFEINTLRQILMSYRLWAMMADGVKSQHERRDVGRAISREDEALLIQTAGQSRSPALLPLLMLSLDTGLRAAEVRGLRRTDLQLEWVNGVVRQGQLIVMKSKTGGRWPRDSAYSASVRGADPLAFTFSRRSPR
jgi:integrase